MLSIMTKSSKENMIAKNKVTKVVNASGHLIAETDSNGKL